MVAAFEIKQEEEIEEQLSDHEDGELSTDEDEAPTEIPANKPNLLIDYPSSDDEVPPEEVIKAYAEKVKKVEVEAVEVDSKMCRVCVKNEHKYRCPRCDIRTCSLDCSKKHKVDNDCDGVRQPFAKVAKLSQYDPQKSIDDQKFMQLLKEKVGLGTEQNAASSSEVTNSDGEEKPVDTNALRYTTNSPTERYLLNAARFRHVWLGFTDAPGNESRHEQHSDTVFWNMKLAFKKQKADGEVEVFEKIVTNIPETIRLVTVLKQFFKPRQYGCIVSESDLEMQKLKPFIERGIDDVNIFMEVHGRPDRFYGVLANNTVLEATRNRVVADHPKFVIILKDEFIDMQLLSPEELEQIQAKYGGVSHGNERFGGGGHRGRGGRGFHRGGGRGGGGQHHHINSRKRPGQGGYDGGFKRGRGGNFNSGNRRGGYQNRNNVDSFDPFEPFAGPVRLPVELMSDMPSTSAGLPEEVNDDDVADLLEDNDDDDMNGMLHGVNVLSHLAGMESENGEQLEEGDVEGMDGDQLVQVINMFMRNECSYDQVMRVSGGQTLQEELGEGRRRQIRLGDEDGVEEVNAAAEEYYEEEEQETMEEYEDDEDAVLMDEVESSAMHANRGIPMRVPSRIEDRFDALPEEARYIVNQMMGESALSLGVSEGPMKSISEALRSQFDRTSGEREQPPLKQVKLEGEAHSSSQDDTSGGGEPRERDRGKAKRLDSLLGQANVLAARGNVTDAMELLREVIRQDHKHAMAYQQIATVYEQEGDHQKALQFGLLASHLDPRTPAEDWVHWGDEATKFNMLDEAALCYDRAVHLNQENWKYYEKRIDILDQLNLRPLAMRTRLQAAQSINHHLADVDFQWFNELIRKVAHYYITMNDEEKAILALEAFVLRSREFGENAEAQHETLVKMHMTKNKFHQAGKSIVSLCKGVRAVHKETKEPACDIKYTNGTYECLPFPPIGQVEYEIDVSQFPISMHCHLIICLFCLNEIDQSTDLEEQLLKRTVTAGDESFVLDVPRAYKARGNPRFSMRFLVELAKNQSYDWDTSGDYWYLKGCLEMAQKNDAAAMEAFEKVLNLQPDHIDNRIHLSTLQQKAGLFDKALETLQDYDLDNCSAMPDERLLTRQADVLFEAGDSEQFVRTTRMMLAPHFYKIYTAAESQKKRRSVKGKTGTPVLSSTLRTCAQSVIKHTNWERLVKRLGATVEANGGFQTTMTAVDLHDYCMKLVGCLNKMEKHHDALIVCCYAFLHPILFKEDKTTTFQNLIYFCAIKAHCWNLAFEYVRYFYTFALTTHADGSNVAALDMLHRRLFNAMNFVFVNSQNVCYHRFIMRALAKTKDNHALQAISGNNSLITGTYRHAMGEYLRVWVKNKKNPLICLLLALTFTHMSCKKDLSSRHLISIRGIAFMKKYSKVRTCQQEIYYNTARMFHQMSILPLAKHFYDKVLEEAPPTVFAFDDEGNEITKEALRYDLRKMAAHNLALIYRTSGNNYAAREIYEKYLVV
ncbi:unnamed protein product [Caenorhabditis sp. 36 PRJEB53466]|nr:unnamed protein product [Caenorhabditis sp. 36 PRJEB53466]